MQKINRVGTIDKTVSQNVIFSKRYMTKIEVVENDYVVIHYVEESAEEKNYSSKSVPFDLFTKNAEQEIWDCLDQSEGIELKEDEF